MMAPKPVYLLADSQLLFIKGADGRPFLQSLREAIDAPDPIAAYIGANNNDEPAYYEMFQQAMALLGITHCHMIEYGFGHKAKALLESAHVIVIAGGDPKLGWQRMHENEVPQLLAKKYAEGATIIGISAGAMQLGWQAPETGNEGQLQLFDTIRLVPAIIGAHDEANNWATLKQMLLASTSMKRGIGIPFGAGVVCHPDQTIEIMRKPVDEFVVKEGAIQHAILIPGTDKAHQP